MPEDWLTILEAAELSGYHPEHIRELVRGGKIKAQKFGPVWAVNQQSLMSYVKAGTDSGDKRRGPKTN